MIYRKFFILIIVCLVIPGFVARAQSTGSTLTPDVSITPDSSPTVSPPSVAILSPEPGQPLQGSITITGSTEIDKFQSADLLFAYSNDPTRTWFLIQTQDSPILQGNLAQWDTSTITDGTYDLRLLVNLSDGTQKDFIVRRIRVRNYTPIETNTPTPVMPTATQQPGDTPVPSTTPIPTDTPVPATPTGLPPNPAQLNLSDITLSVSKGVLGVIGLFALIGLYQSASKLRRRD